MPITKEQASDLKSLHERKVRTALALQMAQVADSEAQVQLDNMMWKLQNEQQ